MFLMLKKKHVLKKSMYRTLNQEIGTRSYMLHPDEAAEAAAAGPETSRFRLGGPSNMVVAKTPGT